MSTYGLVINGRKVSTADSFPVLNPATEEAVAQCPFATPGHLDDAVAAAGKAFKAWSVVSDQERSAACGAIADAHYPAF